MISTNAANAIMTNHFISVFLEIVQAMICNAVDLEDAAADHCSSNVGYSHQDRVCFRVGLRKPIK
jgi:hypothetical protein